MKLILSKILSVSSPTFGLISSAYICNKGIMSDMKKTGFLLKRINSFIIFTFPSITNVVRRCALQLLMSKQKTLDKQTLKEALQKETQKM